MYEILLFLLRFLLSLLLLFLFSFSFLSADHELVHGRSQELLDREFHETWWSYRYMVAMVMNYQIINHDISNVK
jgi:hypothetical protein